MSREFVGNLDLLLEEGCRTLRIGFDMSVRIDKRTSSTPQDALARHVQANPTILKRYVLWRIAHELHELFTHDATFVTGSRGSHDDIYDILDELEAAIALLPEADRPTTRDVSAANEFLQDFFEILRVHVHYADNGISVEDLGPCRSQDSKR